MARGGQPPMANYTLVKSKAPEVRNALQWPTTSRGEVNTALGSYKPCVKCFAIMLTCSLILGLFTRKMADVVAEQ